MIKGRREKKQEEPHICTGISNNCYYAGLKYYTLSKYTIFEHKYIKITRFYFEKLICFL